MSHYHCEIVIPPTDNVEDAIRTVLAPFSENIHDNGGDLGLGLAFWDYWVIGGRYSGSKIEAMCDPEKLAEFQSWLGAQKVTVSSLRCGKAELSPASQAEIVDAKWNEMFPSEKFTPCPLFKHSGERMSLDISRLGETPIDMKCFRAIIAAPSYEMTTQDWTGPLSARFMVQQEFYNGVSWLSTSWDGTLRSALKMCADLNSRCTPEYADRATPTDDWLVVTVDYHS